MRFVVFFVGGICEELGWTALATDRLQGRWNALEAGLIVGVVWALLHVPADFQAGRALTWIVWQRLGTVVLHILIVWLYNNTGHSAFATIRCRALYPGAWSLTNRSRTRRKVSSCAPVLFVIE